MIVLNEDIHSIYSSQKEDAKTQDQDLPGSCNAIVLVFYLIDGKQNSWNKVSLPNQLKTDIICWVFD